MAYKSVNFRQAYRANFCSPLSPKIFWYSTALEFEFTFF